MQKLDVSFLCENVVYGRVKPFSITPFSDAEFRILFDSLIGKPTPYTLEFRCDNPIPNTNRMNRVEFIDFVEGGIYNTILDNLKKRRGYLKFQFSESYKITGAVVDKLFAKKCRAIYPFSDFLLGTYDGFYGAGGIGGSSYFNGTISDSRHYNTNNNDIALNVLTAMHWSETLQGKKPNVVRKQFLAAMEKAFNIPFEPAYTDINNNTRIEFKVVNVGIKPESIKRYLMKILYELTPEQ